MIAANEALQMVREVRTGLDRDFLIIAVSGATAGELDYEDVIRRSSSAGPEVALEDRDLYALQFTGGTTGKPKGVLTDHGAFGHGVDGVVGAFAVHVRSDAAQARVPGAAGTLGGAAAPDAAPR